MSRPQAVFFVKFKSALSLEAVMEIAASRIEEFRAIGGLEQKYYVHDRETGEIGGMYVWESDEAMNAFLASELRATIAEAYKVEGVPRVEIYDILEVLR